MRCSFRKIRNLLHHASRFAAFVAILTLFALAPCAALAQPGPGPGPIPGPGPGPRPGRGEMRQIPSERYYAGARLIESGEFGSAVRFYNTELKDSMKIGPNLWIDSICYYAMLGETYYQAGNLDEALKNYNASLTIAMAYPNWMAKVTFIGGVSPRAKAPSPWGVSRRANPAGLFPAKATIIIGEGETQASRQLGIVAEQHAIGIDAIEILRCIALSIRRRIDIIGPLAPFDPMSEEILETFRTRAVAPNHWSIVFLDVIWGLALEESDKTQSAVKALNDALMASGQFDHTLTGTALVELGHIFLRANKIREAAECYYEAAQSAFQFGDQLLLEEALRDYSNCSKALRGGAADPALARAYRWAKEQGSLKILQTSLALELLEDMIYSGKLREAKSGLTALEISMRGEIRRTIHADRWNYLNALFFYATGDTSQGDASLALVVEGARVRSTWARQLGKLDANVQRGLSADGPFTPRNAIDLYEELLREPTVVDWAVNPTDSLAIQMIAPIAAYERQFQLLFDRDLKDRAFQVAERIRRERFFSTQTYGGRLISLRYIMTADETLTTASLRAARESLNFAYPDFEASAKAAADIMGKLNAMPSVVSDRDAAKLQESLFAELDKVSVSQEATLRFIAAGRVRIPYVFPPVYTAEEVQKRMPPDTAILSFIDAGGDVYGFMIGKENLDAWRVGPSRKVAAAVAEFLKTMGNADGSRYVEAEFIGDDLWKAQGSRLREIVLGASDVDADRFNIVFSKLAVVPDSSLWYLPFEALCLPKAASSADEDDEEAADEENTEKEEDAHENDDADASENDEETNQDDEDAKKAAREAQYDDLDAGYYDEEEEDSDVSDAADFLAGQDDSDEIDGEASAPASDDDKGSEPGAAESADDKSEEVAAPVKRKSRSAREREQLEAFEATLMPMIAAPDFTIRYSATVSLALPNAVGRNAFVATTLIAGATFPKEPTERVEDAVERFSDAIPKTEATTSDKMRAIPGNLYAARLKRLVVWEEVVANVWNWSPIVLGAKPRPGNSVSAWIESPWGAPRLIVMPALRTRAENSLKNGGDGSELALAVLAMQASGADTMLLSRWRTGGRSAYDLSQAFVKNYEEEPAADAWKDAVLALMERDVVVDEEPRLKKLGRSESVPKYTAPFWWAGYMLIDSGEAVEEEDLEEFDEDAVRKAEEENALLKDDKKNGAADDSEDDEAKKEGDDEAKKEGDVENEDAGDDEEEGPRAVFVTPKKDADDEAPFSSGPTTLTDEELAAQDEEGDDFFAVDEEDEPENAPETDQKGGAEPKKDDAPDADSDDAPEEEPGIEPESGDKPTTGSDDGGTPKDDSNDDSNDEPQEDSKSGKKSAGRLSLKGKGKSK